MQLVLMIMHTKEKEITVNMGEIKFSHKPAVFSCSGLGSCVLLFVYEPNSTISGVAHIMLPDSSSARDADNKALYADTSTKLLIQKLLSIGATQEKLKAKIVGGANLFSWANSHQMARLGEYNIDRVKTELIKNKIYIAAEEVGGTMYKTARCHSLTGKIVIKVEKDHEKVI
ncbi:MAG: chemotaxis protein CheD [Sphingobacteriales bacterium]|nr:MAG: chemotaxis protein CheD [Sphingobacteriales bacterium]